MTKNEGDGVAAQGPNDTPELEDELRSIRATGENAGTTGAEPDDEKDDRA